MNLYNYLKKLDGILEKDAQKRWFTRLSSRVKGGLQLYRRASESKRCSIQKEFINRLRTEEIKAWYSEPEGNSLFQGTSVSSLTIPQQLNSPLELRSIFELEESIAESYVALHNKHAKTVKNTIMENTDQWMAEGLYYAVVLSSKIIAQAFGLSVLYKDVVYKIGGHIVDPHEITSYPSNIRQAYFKKCLQDLNVFTGLQLERREFEASLVLADISKPRIKKYKNKIILAPVRCNEIAAILSDRVTALIIEKSSGKIKPRSLAVVIFDTDTPYTYHQIMGYARNRFAPILPGLIILGASGTIDAFRWLYAYRLSLITQKIMKSSLHSEIHKSFIPFVFFGVLVPRDAQILLDMGNLQRVRYKGNFDPDIEFSYLLPAYFECIKSFGSIPAERDLRKNYSI